MVFQSELNVDDRLDGNDGVIAGLLSNANDTIEWLKMNGPYNEKEIDDLIYMIINFKMNDDVTIGYYGIREVYGQRMIFGPRNMLYIQGDELVAYLVELLVGMKEDLSVVDELGNAA